MSGSKKGVVLIVLLVWAISSSCDPYAFVLVKVRNDYFEMLTNIVVHETSFGSLEVGEQSSAKSIAQGEWSIVGDTKTGLHLVGSIVVKNREEEVLIIIDSKGHVRLK